MGSHISSYELREKLQKPVGSSLGERAFLSDSPTYGASVLGYTALIIQGLNPSLPYCLHLPFPFDSVAFSSLSVSSWPFKMATYLWLG
jgi:hypothetical protein